MCLTASLFLAESQHCRATMVRPRVWPVLRVAASARGRARAPAALLPALAPSRGGRRRGHEVILRPELTADVQRNP